MPVEIEVPTEHLHEMVHEEHHKATGHGDHGGGDHGADHKDKSGGNFTMGVALSSAVLAVLAALAALFAGHHANEAMLERVEASDQWSYYQAKGIKGNVLKSKLELLAALDKPADPRDLAKVEEYKNDQNKIEEEAKELQHSSEGHLDRHVTLARSVTFFQVAIALGAIAVLTKRKPLWFVSVGVGAVGTAFLVIGLQSLPPPPVIPEGEGSEAKGHGAHAAKAEGHGEAKAEAHGEAKAEGEHAAPSAEHAAVPVPAEKAAEKPAEKPAEEHK